MSDEISRDEIAAMLARESMSEEMTKQDAIERLAALWDNRHPLQCKAIDMAITALSAEPMRWISVKEKLPEESGYYLATVEDDTEYDVMVTRSAWYDKEENEWRIWSRVKVVAWAMLPKPWSGKESE